MEKIHIIAEAGNNHNGDYQTALKLVDVANRSGADSVKFQTIYPEKLYVPKIFDNGSYKENEIIAIRHKSMLTDDEYAKISEYCQSVGIGFSSSVFDGDGVALIDRLNAPYIKIASTDLNNTSLLRIAARTGKQLIISTGMSVLSEIEKAVKTVVDEGNEKIVLLHCVSVYPADPSITNLNFIDQLKSEFGYSVGFSDHTESSIAAAVAVSKGVEYIEKHFTLDRASEGFDHCYAMEPDSFEQYVKDIRSIETACTSASKKLTDDENGVAQRARRGLFVSRDMSAGEIITEKDVLVVRPPSEFAADQIDDLVGKKLIVDKKMYSAFSAKDM